MPTSLSKLWCTYILENPDVSDSGQGNRRYYVGRTTNMDQRMEEHKKDGRQNYMCVYIHFSDIEQQLKKFGPANFMKLPFPEKKNLECAFETIKRLKNVCNRGEQK